MKTDNLILVGNPASGKSNYLGAALGYMAKQMDDAICLVGVNSESRELIDSVEDKFKEGRWLEKTGGATNKKHLEYDVHFATTLSDLCRQLKIKLNPTGPFWSHARLHVEDWAGESFQGLRMAEKAEHIRDFLQDSLSANHVMVFFDGIEIANPDTIGDLQKDLGLLLEAQKKIDDERARDRGQTFWGKVRNVLLSPKRVMSIVVTKCDAFEGNSQFCDDSGHASVEKVERYIMDKYTSFKAVTNHYNAKFFCVSCVPNPEHRVHHPKKGIMPNASWSVKDMESQVDAMKWIFNNLY